MSETLQKIQEKIDIDQEKLALLPRNNLKNVTKTLEKIDEVRGEYTKLHDDIIDEISNRYKKLEKIEENPEIKKIEQEIQNIEENVIINKMKTSYEKMELDRLIYSINGFYKKNLDSVNKDIYEVLKKFESVGILLTDKDFNYSEYAHEYMKVFIEEAKKGNINTERIKNTFEKLYVKCSEVITHISLNIRSLYHKNEKNIDKFYATKKEQTLKEKDATEEQIVEKCEAMKARVKSLKDKDEKTILNKFLNSELLINDYRKDNIDGLINRMKASEKSNDEDFYDNIKKLSNNLKEYQIYVEFKFLIDDIVAMYKKPDNSKKSKYDEKIEEIEKAEKKLNQLNNSLEKKNKMLLFMSKNKNNESEVLERNNQIIILKDLYRQLDDYMIDRAVKAKISETSTILDTLTFATSFYNFIARRIIKQFPEILEDEINAMIQKLKQAIKEPNLTVINNMNITELKDMTIIIKDKYKLLGLNISKEDFEEQNIEGLVSTVKTLTVYKNINNSKLTIEDIKFMCRAKELLDK